MLGSLHTPAPKYSFTEQPSFLAFSFAPLPFSFSIPTLLGRICHSSGIADYAPNLVVETHSPEIFVTGVVDRDVTIVGGAIDGDATILVVRGLALYMNCWGGHPNKRATRERQEVKTKGSESSTGKDLPVNLTPGS